MPCNDIDHKRAAREKAFKKADFYNTFQASTAWNRGFDAGWDAARELEERAMRGEIRIGLENQEKGENENVI